MRPILPLLLLLISQLAIGQTLEKKYLEEGKQVIEAFYKLYGDTTVSYHVPRIGFKNFGKIAGPIKKRVYSSGKGFIVNQTVKYFIKPYKHLSKDDQYQLERWTRQAGFKETGEELYYKLVVYWILPRTLAHSLIPPSFYRDKDIKVALDTKLDEYTLHFLIRGKFLRQFSSFESIIHAIEQLTEKRIGSQLYVSDLIQGKKSIKDFTQFWHLRALSMQQVIQNAKG